MTTTLPPGVPAPPEQATRIADLRAELARPHTESEQRDLWEALADATHQEPQGGPSCP
jgi:hypothetical protein